MVQMPRNHVFPHSGPKGYFLSEGLGASVYRGSFVFDPTMYFTSTSTTVNGLSARLLSTSQGTTSAYKDITNYDYEIGIRVWKRNSSGVETEITGGSPVAVAAIPASSGYVSGSWNCPQTSLASTDAVVVRVYASADGSTWSLVDTWITQQLGAQSLNASTWTVYYYIYIRSSPYKVLFYFGTSTYNSRIENFAWTALTSVSNTLSSTYRIWAKFSGYSDSTNVAKIEAMDFNDYISKLKLASIIWYKKEVSPSYGTVGYTTVTLETIFSDDQAPDPREISVVFNLRSQLDSSTTLSTTVPVYSLATKIFRAIGSIPIPEDVPLNCYDLQIEVDYLAA